RGRGCMGTCDICHDDEKGIRHHPWRRPARRPNRGDPACPAQAVSRSDMIDEEVETKSAHDLVQLLTPEGERVEHPDYPLDLSDDEIRDLYRDLVTVRRIDFEAVALTRQGELGIWASLLGQEAAQIGS